MMDLKKIEAVALEAQKDHIQWRLLSNIGGTMRRIEKWDDFRYHLSWFFTPKGHVGSMSDSDVRILMRRLAEAGVVEVEPHRRPYGMLRWRFSREVCDRLAAEVIAHWESVGYSQHENRRSVECA